MNALTYQSAWILLSTTTLRSFPEATGRSRSGVGTPVSEKLQSYKSGVPGQHAWSKATWGSTCKSMPGYALSWHITSRRIGMCGSVCSAILRPCD